MSQKRRIPRPLASDERILLVMNVLILILLGIGVPAFLAGRFLDNVTVSMVAAYLIVIGIIALVARIVYWVAEEIVKQGVESMRDATMTQ